MASDTELFLAGFEDEEFAGASVTAKAPAKTYVDNTPAAGTIMSDLSTKGTGFGDITAQTPLGAGSQQEVVGDINAPVDATIDIVGNSGTDDTNLFLSGFDAETPKEPKMSMQEYAKTLPKDMSWEDRQIALREYRRDNLENVQAPGLNTDQRASDFALGMSQTLIGVPATALDIARYTGLGYVLDKSGIDFTGLDEATQAKINQLKANVKDTDIFSANTMGQILPTLAALPVHVSRKLTASLLDAGITYVAMQGAGNDDVTSAIGAIAAGGLTAGTMSILERLNGSTALDDVVTNLAAGKNVDTIYRNFAKFTGKDIELMTNHDKVVAILSSSEQQGASTLLRMAARDSKLKKSIDALMESPNNVVNAALQGNNIARTVNDLRDQTKFAKSAYNELEKLAITYPTANINIGPAKQSLVDELSAIPEIKRSAGINKVLSTLQKDNISMADILDMRKHLSGINFKASRIDTKTRESINAVEYLDSVVDANLPAEFKQAFGEARSELALSYALQGKNAKKKFNNKFGELTLEIGKGNETYATTLEKLVKATGGTNKFNELHRGLGYEQAKQFELGLIKEIQNTKGENLGELLGMVKELGFVTPEARDMVKRIRMLDKSFSSADFYNEATRVAIAGGLDSASITNDFLSKVQYSVAGTIWNSIKPYVLPIGDNAAQERMFRGIMSSVEKGLKSDTRAIKLEVPHADMYKDFKPIVREAIENSIRTQIDNIKGMSGAKVPEGQATNLLDAPADFTVRADGSAIRQSGDAAQDALSREPINTTIVDEANVPSTSVKPSEDIIDVEWWNPTSTVITPDGHILSMEELLRAESLPDNMRLPEKASAPIKNFFDMKLKLKTDPDLIKAREEVKKAKTAPDKDKAKGRLVKLLEYQRLREQGMKPADANRLAMQSSSEVGGALAGGTINGVTIDDNGNIQVDPEAFLIGAAGGTTVVKGGKQLGKQLSEAKEYYHGTESVFTKFDASQNPQGLVWFTNDKDYAKTAGPNLHTVKLDVKNTFDFTKKEHLDMLLKSGKVNKEEIDALVNKGYAHREQPYIIELLKKLGFDSVYTEKEGKRKAIAVFNVDKQAKHKSINNTTDK